MVALPQSIENALKEAGFSPTEILILNHLLEEQGMTLRELAAKTGKSTGVLDQAMKKLLRRRIVERQIINDTPKYLVTSMQSIVDWMEEDTRQRREEIDRRYQNFESFILTLERERSRPHVEHFEGLEGMRRAYSKLLEYGGKDIIGYVPQLFKEESDPLREFKVQWFRDRYNAGAFLRLITHEGAMGRRFQNRDAFEYRKSILVNADRYPIALEKYVTQNVLATIDYNKRSAMFLHYPELAKSEREMFEQIWKARTEEAASSGQAKPPVEPAAPEQREVPIEIRTKLVSLIREFFAGPKSWIAIGFCAVIAASLSFTIHSTSVRINTERIRERVTAIASTATVEFRPEELSQLRTMKDVDTPAYRNVVERLKQIRRRNPDIMYVYLLRPPKQGTLFEFIADADAEHPSKVPDTNGDGVITPADDLGFPGVQYDGSYIDVLRNHEYEVPIATREPYSDKWGTFFTGYAPIRDNAGNLAALIAVDMTSKDLASYNSETYSPLLGFAVLFTLFITLRFSATNGTALRQLLPGTHRLLRKSVVVPAIAAIVFFAMLLLWRQKEAIVRSYGEKAMAIAATAALQIDADDLAVLHKAEDMKRPEYQRVFRQLNDIRSENPGVIYVDIFRKTQVDGIWEFVADADTNYDVFHLTDTNVDGRLDEMDENTWPGMAYDAKGYSPAAYERAFQKPYFVEMSDQWGDFLSGNAPIFDTSGTAVAELNINFDMNAILRKEFGAILAAFVAPLTARALLLSLPLFLFLMCIRFVSMHAKALKVLLAPRNLRLSVLWAVFVVLLVLFGILLFQHMREQSRIRAVGERAQAIAATAALLIDPSDLAVIRKAADMKTPEYRRAYDILNTVRDQNPEIAYIYIMRKTGVEGIWEFVVDADTSATTPAYVDYNSDGVIGSDEDETLWPGFAYDAEHISPEWYRGAFLAPMYSTHLVQDQWGDFISGSSPILDSAGHPVAIVGVDFILR